VLYRDGQTAVNLSVESPDEIAKKLASVHSLLTLTPNLLKIDRVTIPGMPGKWVRVRAASGLNLATVPL
jgi:hypothetical protein